MTTLARYLFLAAALAACLQGDDDMGLPSTRDVTFTPLSPVPSAVLNDIQDSIVGHETALVANTTRLSGGAGAAVSFALAPTAPDYHFTGVRHRTIPATAGTPELAGHWLSPAGSVVYDGSAGPGLFTIPLVVESGETIGVLLFLSQDVATAGGAAVLAHIGSTGSETIVQTVGILASTSDQTLTFIGHVVVPLHFYYIRIGFGVGASNKAIRGADIAYTR